MAASSDRSNRSDTCNGVGIGVDIIFCIVLRNHSGGSMIQCRDVKIITVM